MRLLSVRDLHIQVPLGKGQAMAVRGADLDLEQGQVTALVGESGCGKSLTASAIMNLLPAGARCASGQVLWQGRDLLQQDALAWQAMRGSAMSMVFQDPSAALDPVMQVGQQVVEALQAHGAQSTGSAWEQACTLLAQVGIPDALRRAQEYPHQFSGGMKQRAVLAMALACRPQLLIADEPTTALDVTVQAQILELLGGLRQALGLTVLLITHDLSLVARLADQLAVMYAGKVVEQGPVRQVLQAPAHPYTRALLSCLPTLAGEFKALEGQVPDLGSHSAGCSFEPRCSQAFAACSQEPAMVACGLDRTAACHLWQGGKHAA
jgi:oligopeptide/dipeptide ABC transporter ATP-binding protein